MKSFLRFVPIIILIFWLQVVVCQLKKSDGNRNVRILSIRSLICISLQTTIGYPIVLPCESSPWMSSEHRFCVHTAERDTRRRETKKERKKERKQERKKIRCYLFHHQRCGTSVHFYSGYWSIILAVSSCSFKISVSISCSLEKNFFFQKGIWQNYLMSQTLEPETDELFPA